MRSHRFPSRRAVTRRAPRCVFPAWQWLARTGCGALLLALLAPAPAAPASALYLTWNGCPLDGPSASDIVFTCDVNDGEEDLYCALTLPQPTGADVLGFIAVVDVQHSVDPLPAWWQLAKSGACRSGQIDADVGTPLGPACVDPWLGNAVAQIQGYDVGSPRGGANQARIRAVCGVVPDSARTLDDTSLYYGLRIRILNDLTTGAGSCTGCAGGACLVLNSIEVVRLPGAPGGNLFIQTPAPGNANWATWRGGGGANCMLVPARNVTWGRVKSLYR